MVLTSSLFLLVGTASARPAVPQNPAQLGTGAAACTVHTLPSFVQQGENIGGVNESAMVADIIEVECNPLEYKTGQKIIISASQLKSLCGTLKWWNESPFVNLGEGSKVTVALDADGNATVAVIGGPGCQQGESFITADETEAPFVSFTSTFHSEPPSNTPIGMKVLNPYASVAEGPTQQVENATDSNILDIVEVEDAAQGENLVHIQSPELYARCKFGAKLTWIRANGEEETGEEINKVKLDNNGNAFVIVAGHESCRTGISMIEADLEETPFKSWQTSFEILNPQTT
jgi:hypothetical protein